VEVSLFELSDLCARTGVTARTVRYYIQQGLLRSPGQTGPGAKYDQGHLSRLLLIRRLQHEHLPLAEIRKRLHALDDSSVRALLQQQPHRSSAADYVREVLSRPGKSNTTGVKPKAPPPNAPKTLFPDRSQWERVAISADVEIHIRRPLSRDDSRRVERLIGEARRVINGETTAR
jgi:DNA-binding transcriptional MerR regulator